MFLPNWEFLLILFFDPTWWFHCEDHFQENTCFRFVVHVWFLGLNNSISYVWKLSTLGASWYAMRRSIRMDLMKHTGVRPSPSETSCLDLSDLQPKILAQFRWCFVSLLGGCLPFFLIYKLLTLFLNNVSLQTRFFIFGKEGGGTSNIIPVPYRTPTGEKKTQRHGTDRPTAVSVACAIGKTSNAQLGGGFNDVWFF